MEAVPKQRRPAWHCSCSGIPTVLFCSQGPCEGLRFWSSFPFCHTGFVLTGAELVFCQERSKVHGSPHLCHGRFCPAAGSDSAQSHWGDTGLSGAGEDVPQLIGSKGAYPSGSARCPLLLCPASQCGTRACCWNSGSAAVPHSSTGCHSFSGSGTWAGTQPAVTNTREVRCSTVLMGGESLSPHGLTSLFSTATPGFWKGLGCLGPPNLQRSQESTGRGGWTMPKAQNSKPWQQLRADATRTLLPRGSCPFLAHPCYGEA